MPDKSTNGNNRSGALRITFSSTNLNTTNKNASFRGNTHRMSIAEEYNNSNNSSEREYQFQIVCSSTLRDWFYIILFYLLFYSFLFGLTSLMLKGAFDTANTGHTLLWSFLFFGVLFGIFVSGAVHFGMKQLEKEKKEEKIKRRLSMNGNAGSGSGAQVSLP